MPDALPTQTPARRRALYAFAVAAAGIASGVLMPEVHPAAWFGASLVAASLAMMRAGMTTRLALLVSLSLLAAGFAAVRLDPPRPGAFAASLSPDRAQIIDLDGIVSRAPEARSPRPGSLEEYAVGARGRGASFPLELTRAGGRPAAGRVWVSGPASITTAVRAGDVVRLTASVRAPQPELNPAPIAADRTLRNRQSGVVARARLGRTPIVETVSPRSPREHISAIWHRLRSALRARARTALGVDDDPRGALLGAIVLGERSGEAAELSRTFRRAGVLHLLSISGFHVAVMAGAALLAVRLTGERGALEPLLVALLIGVYLLVVPVRAPILRSGAMALALLGARLLGRRHDPVAVLAWVAIGVLVWRPLELFSMGYQLSFGLVAMLILWGERRARDRLLLIDRGREPTPIAWLGRACVEFVWACVLCWSAAVPIILLHGGSISPYGIVASIVATPVAILLLWLAFAALLIGVIADPLARLMEPIIGSVSDALASVVSAIESWPGATLHLPDVGVAWPTFACIVVVVVITRGYARAWWAWALSAAALVWLGAVVVMPPQAPRLRLDMLAVGDGTCLLVRSRGETLLWDAGSLAGSSRSVIISLRRLGVREIDAAVVSHANIDHYAYLPELANEFRIGRLLGNESIALSDAPAVVRLRSLLDERGVATEAWESGEQITLGDCTLRAVSPPDSGSMRAENDRSLVVLIETPTDAGLARVLLTGDIQRAGIARLLERVPVVDVLELPHHGSFNPLSRALVERASPAVVLQSTGPSRVDDPRWAGSRAGRLWRTTATDGWTWIEIDDAGAMRGGSKR